MRSPVSRLSLIVRSLILLSLLLALASAAAAPTATPAVIPNPAVLKLGRGQFVLDASVAIRIRSGDAELQAAANYLSDLIFQRYAIRLPVRVGGTGQRAIQLSRSLLRGQAESYRVRVRPRQVALAAHSYEGLLHASRTLWQLIGRNATAPTLTIPALRIDDAPRFAWRGIMLDSARHYQSPAFIRHYIDWMALHKLNVLHWHLTDDQAWRLQIRKYPRLTDIGAWRVPAGRAAAADIDPATGKARTYGGFYTQDEVRAIVAHAQSRGVRIVPEIEMPGHASAPLVAYPEFAAGAQPPTEVPADWGIYAHVYGVDDATFGFLEDVLDEVMELFPDEWIHVGGDEVEQGEWAAAPAAQERMRALGLSDPKGLQGYFTQRIGRYLQAHGRRLVGWDEILEPGLAPNAIVMSWRGVDGAIAATAQGHDSVLSPWPTLYFDNRQGDGGDEPPGRLRMISLQDVYRFDPLPNTLSAQQAKHLLGIQGNVWSEHIRTEDRIGWMSFPRAAAVAELGWSIPERRDWPDFLRRLPALFAHYDALQIPHADSAFAVHAKTQYRRDPDRAEVTLSTQTGQGEIRYTLDGSMPSAESLRYAGTLTVALPAKLRATSFSGTQPLAQPRAFALQRSLAGRRSSAELRLCSEDIALGLEDEAPLLGPRAVFHLDIQNPCWIFVQAELDGIDRIAAMVGDVPFNFQIGDAVKKIKLAAPESPDGELLVHLDRCDGRLIARLPLPPISASTAATALTTGAIEPQQGRHDLCLKFTQAGIDPMRAIDWVQLLEAEPSAKVN